jgi:hypothetical protein
MVITFKNQGRLSRLVWMAVGFALTAAAVMIALPWLRAMLAPSAPRKAILGFLIVLEVTYIVVVLLGLIGALFFGMRFWRVRRERMSRVTASRGLLLCVCCLITLALGEGVSATWRASSRWDLSSTVALPELPEQFPEPTDSDEVSIAVLGESSAVGMPYESWISVGRIVAWQLGKAIPGKRFRVELVAKPADTLYGQYEKLSGIRRRPDVLIVYCGHNEFASVIPWSRRVTHYIDEHPSLLWGLDEMAARVSPLCALIRETADKYRIGIGPPQDAQAPLVDKPAYTRGELASRLDGFRRRLDAIVAFGERIGALTILVVPPSNDADFDPNRSFLPAETPRSEREAFAREFLSARESEFSEPTSAIERYRALLDRQPGFAETHYRLAILLSRSGAFEEAYRHFVAARDLDGLPMRCLSSFQDSYRDVAARRHCILIDGQALFHAIGPHGLLNDELFHDAMHPSLRGHMELASAILDELRSRQAFGWSARSSTNEFDPVRCAAHFGLAPKDWKPICERGFMFYFATAPLRFDRTYRVSKQEAFRDAARRIGEGEPPESIGMPNVGVPASLSVRPQSTSCKPTSGPSREGFAVSSFVPKPIIPLNLPVKVRSWELTVYPRSYIRRRLGATRPAKART